MLFIKIRLIMYNHGSATTNNVIIKKNKINFVSPTLMVRLGFRLGYHRVFSGAIVSSFEPEPLRFSTRSLFADITVRILYILQ